MSPEEEHREPKKRKRDFEVEDAVREALRYFSVEQDEVPYFDQFEQRVKDAIIADVRRRLGTERGQSLSDVEIKSRISSRLRTLRAYAKKGDGRAAGGEVATTRNIPATSLMEAKRDRLDDIRAEHVALVKLLYAVKDRIAKRRVDLVELLNVVDDEIARKRDDLAKFLYVVEDGLAIKRVDLVMFLNVVDDAIAKKRVDLVEVLNVVDDAIAKVEKELPRAAQDFG